MRFDDAPGDGQAQAGPARAVAPHAGQVRERLEDPLPIGGRDALPRVRDADLGLVPPMRRAVTVIRPPEGEWSMALSSMIVISWTRWSRSPSTYNGVGA